MSYARVHAAEAGIYTTLEGLGTAMARLSEEITGLRGDLAELRSDLRSVREQNTRQDAELWGGDGLSRLVSVQAEGQRHALQIKGLWAAFSVLIGLITTYAITHLKG